MPGKLYIIATPIGNLSDVSMRTLEAIKGCAFVLAEDTRVSIKLMSHFDIQKRLISCHDFNEENRVKLLADANAQSQSVALISDAGTPLVSDPGYKIVQEAIALNMVVVPIPGPSAFLLALVGSGLPCESFVFEGFLPDKSVMQKRKLQDLKTETRTLIFYVSPHKVLRTLALMSQILGDRRACVARELTKFYEEFIRGKISEIIPILQSREVLGEIVLVLEGASASESDSITDEELRNQIRTLLTSGKSVRDVSAEIAQVHNMKKSEVYKIALQEQSQL
jgi:16S rRNA (cytidine1402-2'-O)-methyltransferase